MAKPSINLNVMDRLKKAEFKEKSLEQKVEEVIVVEKKEYEIVAVEKEEIDFSEKKFDYDLIEDSQMRIDLQDYEQRLHRKKNGYHTALGEILAEANEKYSNNKNGVFGVWLEHLGFNRRTAERLICRWKFIVTNCRNIIATKSEEDIATNCREDDVTNCYNIDMKEYLESLPLSLTYEVSSPNAPKELVDAVLSKKIATRKEFIEMKKNISEEKKSEEVKENVTISFENILGEMQSFNNKYASVAKSIEKIKSSGDREKMEKVFSKMEKLNKEVEMLMREIEE